MSTQNNVPKYQDLKSDSPQLHSQLVSLFGGDLEDFQQAYQLSTASNMSWEGKLKRTVGANFNARPARLAQIVMKELGYQDRKVLLAAFFLCCEVNQLRQLPNGPAQQLAREATRYPAPVCREAEGLALALYLDELRHMHLRGLPQSKLLSELDRAQELMVPSILHLENERLRELIMTAITRLSPDLDQYDA